MAAPSRRRKVEMNCREVEEKLAAYVDGTTRSMDVAAHLDTCDACRASAHAQTVARTVLKARAAQLSPIAPPGLRTHVVANISGESTISRPQDLTTSRPQDLKTFPVLGWTGRLSAFAAAAMVVLTLGAILLPVATVRSTALLAAQLALDHLKCFTIDGDADGQPIPKAVAEATLQQDFDLSVTIPESVPSERLELMAVRRCLYGDGRAAHLMYRLNGEPVSLFIIPGLTRPAAEMSLFGHDQAVWAQGDRTYMLVARGGSRNDLARVASYLRNEAK
jgi:anti-sigma factor RsiW